MKFNQKELTDNAKSVGVVVGALVVGNAAKKLLMSPRGENGEKASIIPDNSVTNGVATVASLLGAGLISNKHAKLLMLVLTGYFGIRTVNKLTENLAGLGNPTANKVGKLIKEWTPQLGNVTVGPDGMSNDFEAIIARAAIPPSAGPQTFLPDSPVLVGVNQPSGGLKAGVLV